MQFLSLSRRLTDRFSESDFAQLREKEVERACILYAEGGIRQIWFRGDEPGACIIWEAVDEQEVRQKLATLPYLVAGMTEVVAVMQLNPYLGFGPRGAEHVRR